MWQQARPLVFALAALALSSAPASVQARSAGVQAGARVGHLHHHHGHGHWRGGFWLGVGIGSAYWPYYGGWAPGYVLVEPVPVVYERPLDARPIAPAAPDPVFTPRQGQSAAQTEYDRQACNRWAMTQADAVADAKVFHRTSLACMEGRGYAVN